jgi:hypothetical protein
MVKRTIRIFETKNHCFPIGFIGLIIQVFACVDFIIFSLSSAKSLHFELFNGDNDSVNQLNNSKIFIQLLLNLLKWCKQIAFDEQNAALEGI